MTMVLRCTGNCPLMDHSIYIDQLHGMGSGWKNIPTLIQEKLQQQNQQPLYRFRTPLDIIHAVRAELQLLMHHQEQEQQPFVIPETPRLPFRNPSSGTATTGATTGTSF